MGQAKSLSSIFLVLILLFIPTGASFQTPMQESTPDFSAFPIIDFKDREPNGANIERLTKNKKFNKRHGKPISESSKQIFTVMDWEVGLPTLPVGRSSSIVVGNITKATAHLSDDNTTIYSEFVIDVSAVVKNDTRMPIKVGESFTVSREGGGVRMPSGKLIVSWVNRQNMPRVGRKYLLFLTHEFPAGGDAGTDSYILTGYELRNGKTTPLDILPVGHPLAAYDGRDESILFNDLLSASRRAQSQKNPR